MEIDDHHDLPPFFLLYLFPLLAGRDIAPEEGYLALIFLWYFLLK